MADQKLTELTALASPTGDDIIYIVDDPGGSAASRKITRTNFLQIGTDLQAWDTQLDDIAALAVTDGNFIVGNGSNWVAESGATARTSLGLGTTDTPEFDGLTIGNNTGVDYNPGSDADTDIITVGVTGTPLLFWDESEDRFEFSHGFRVGTDWIHYRPALARWGIFDGNPQGRLHVTQFSTTGAQPAIYMEQLDVDREFLHFEGTAAAATLTNSIVNVTDVATATAAGYLKIFVTDLGNQITDQAYYIEIVTLA